MPLLQPDPWQAPRTEDEALVLYRLAMMPLGSVEAFWGTRYALASPEHWAQSSATPLAPSPW